MNRFPLQKDAVGVVWALVLDADNVPVTDLTAGDVRISSILAGVVVGPEGTAVGSPFTIDETTVAHALVTSHASMGWYGIRFPATMGDAGAQYALTTAPVEVSIIFNFTALPSAYGSRGVVDPATPFAVPVNANVTQVKGQPISDLVDGDVSVFVNDILPEKMQEQADLNQQYDISIDDDVSPPLATATRKSDQAIVAQWEVDREQRDAIVSMTEPPA